MLCTLIGAIILSINIQVGLNMHQYDHIGDASSSLRGSTSSSLPCGYQNEQYELIFSFVNTRLFYTLHIEEGY